MEDDESDKFSVAADVASICVATAATNFNRSFCCGGKTVLVF